MIINIKCTTVDKIQLIGYEKKRLVPVPKYAKTVFIHKILSAHVQVRDIIIDVTDRLSDLSVAQRTSIIPQIKYVGIIIYILVSAASIETSPEV